MNLNLQKNEIPVVFFHLGRNDYFISALRIALKNNKVIHIGDAPLVEDANYVFVNHNFVNEDVQKFLGVYTHMHPRVGMFEHICFIRWIALRNLMIKYDIETAFYADSDVAVLESVYNSYCDLERPDVAFSIPENPDPYYMVGCGHSSFWRRVKIESFVDYIFRCYQPGNELDVLKDKWQHHLTNNIPGGVCDMTVMYMFSKENRVQKTNKIVNNAVFDHCITISENLEPDEFEMAGRIKKIAFDNQTSTFFGFKMTGEQVKFRGIHCQGDSKQLLLEIERVLSQ